MTVFKKAQFTAGALTVATSAVVALTPQPAHAGGCNPFWPCGEIWNKSGSTVYITRNWGSNDTDRWNAASPLANGQRAGGGSDDIDGFYVTARCHVDVLKFDRGYTAYGPAWHKINNLDSAQLYRYACE